MRSTFRIASLGVAVVLSAFARVAAASPLSIGTLEYDSWPLAVAMLQNNVNAGAAVVHVTVTAGAGARVHCGQYSLSFDEAAAAAFALGACDPDSQATEVRLVDRSALFDHSAEVPEPRPAGLTATAVLTAFARGGAARAAGTEVRCSVAIRPYLTDLEHGTRVYITPGRFVLRMRDPSASARATPDQWTLEQRVAPDAVMLRRRQASVTLAYEVFDTERNETVVRDTARLSCAQYVGEPPDPVEAPAPTDDTAAVPEAPQQETRTDAGGMRLTHGTLEIHGARVNIRGGSVVIERGGSLVISNGGSLRIGGDAE